MRFKKELLKNHNNQLCFVIFTMLLGSYFTFATHNSDVPIF